MSKPHRGQGVRGASAPKAAEGSELIRYAVYQPPAELLPRLAGYIGLAQKAGKTAAGDGAAKEALLKGRAVLLLLAADAGAAVKNELQALCRAADLPLLLWTDKDALGLIVGKSRRGAVALLDEGLAAAVLRLLPEAALLPEDDIIIE